MPSLSLNALKPKSCLPLLLILFAFALTSRLLAMGEFVETPYYRFTLETHGPDQHKFFQWAKSIYPGDGLPDHGFGGMVFSYAPLYSYLIALIFRATSVSVTGILILQIVFSSSLVFLFYLLGRHWNARLAGVTAAALWAFYGPSSFYDSCLIRASLIASLAFFLFAAFTFSLRKEGLHGGWVLTGILLGLFTVLRPHVLFLALPLWILVREGLRPWRSNLPKALAVLIFALLVISPVTIRNYRISGQFVPIATQGVEALWLGNTPGGVGVAYHQSDETLALEYESDLKLSKSLAVIAREFVKDPLAYAKLYRRKIKMLFNDYEVPGNYTYDVFKRLTPSSKLTGVSFLWIFPFAVIGLLEGIRRRSDLKDLYFFFLVFLLSAVLIHIQSRYRHPVLPFFLLFAGLGIARLHQFLAMKKFRTAFLYIAMAIPLFLYATPYPSYGKIMRFTAEGEAMLNTHKIRDVDYITLIFSYMMTDAARYRDKIDGFADEALRHYGPFFAARYHLEYEKYKERLGEIREE